jgi:predicted nucleotidyltransferase component of viral defense system
MSKTRVLDCQRRILRLVADRYPQVYLVGGTALSLSFKHRYSEDLDFFTQHYTATLHRQMASFISRVTGFSFSMIEEEKRSRYVKMAVYEFEIGRHSVLKVDFVSDVSALLKPRRRNGLASVEDIYCRKILAVIGWKMKASSVGRVLAGGRQKTKDLYDIFYLSGRFEVLSDFFPKYFDAHAYERLVSWYLNISKQRAITELLELVPKCDTKSVFMTLDDEIIYKLNKRYAGL